MNWINRQERHVGQRPSRKASRLLCHRTQIRSQFDVEYPLSSPMFRSQWNSVLFMTRHRLCLVWNQSHQTARRAGNEVNEACSITYGTIRDDPTNNTVIPRSSASNRPLAASHSSVRSLVSVAVFHLFVSALEEKAFHLPNNTFSEFSRLSDSRGFSCLSRLLSRKWPNSTHRSATGFLGDERTVAASQSRSRFSEM
jgi:hypothetical protein